MWDVNPKGGSPIPPSKRCSSSIFEVHRFCVIQLFGSNFHHPPPWKLADVCLSIKPSTVCRRQVFFSRCLAAKSSRNCAPQNCAKDGIDRQLDRWGCLYCKRGLNMSDHGFKFRIIYTRFFLPRLSLITVASVRSDMERFEVLLHNSHRNWFVTLDIYIYIHNICI